MLHQQIRTLRTARNMSQVQLAQLLGVTKQSVSNWENDNIQPSIDMLVRLAQVFGVSCDYLLGLHNKATLDVSGLPEETVSHLRQLVQELQKAAQG